MFTSRFSIQYAKTFAPSPDSALGASLAPTKHPNKLNNTDDAMEDMDFMQSEPTQAQFDQEQVNLQMQQIYHQDPTPLSQRADTSNLWVFPDPVGKGLVIGNAHPIPKLFLKTCALIRKHWGIDPKDVVPEQVRPYTPYSLAVFLALRRCTSHSKQRPDIGREAILSVWRDRVENTQFDGSATSAFETRVEDTLIGSASCEIVIQESNYGLTIEDAIKAIRLATKMTREHEQQFPQASGELRGGDRAAKKAAKKAAREERKAKQQSHDKGLKKRKEAASTFEAKKVTKNDRKKAAKAATVGAKVNGEAGYKLLQFLHDKEDDEDGGVTLTGLEYGNVGDSDGASVAPPNSPTAQAQAEDMQDAPDSTSTSRRSLRPRRPAPAKHQAHLDDPDFATHANRLDRHNDSLLSSMFNRVDMDSKQALKAKKAKALMASAAKHDGTLPSERVKFAEMPTLYAQQGNRLQDEASEILQRMKLSGELEKDVDGEQGGVKLGAVDDEDEEL